MTDAQQQATPALTFHLALDANDIVVGAAQSNVEQPGMQDVDADTYAVASARIGQCKLVGGELQDYAPPAPATPPRQQLGTVFLGAIVDLGWWSLMDGGATAQGAAGKPLDQRYWLSIGKADLVLATDAKLNRVAAAAERARVAASGQPAPATPVITIAAAMDHGDAMVASEAPPATSVAPAAGSATSAGT